MTKKFLQKLYRKNSWMRYYYGIPKSNSEMVELVQEIKKNIPDGIIRPSQEEYDLNRELWNRFIRIARMAGLDIEIA